MRSNGLIILLLFEIMMQLKIIGKHDFFCSTRHKQASDLFGRMEGKDSKQEARFIIS